MPNQISLRTRRHHSSFVFLFLIVLASARNIFKTCSVEEFMGKTYFLPFTHDSASVCWKIELFANGVINIDPNNPYCENGSYDDGQGISTFNNANENTVFFSRDADSHNDEGLVQFGWEGQLTIEEGNADIELAVLNYDESSKIFEVILLVSSCDTLIQDTVTTTKDIPAVRPKTQAIDLPTCAAEELMGKTYYVPYETIFIKSCYKIQLFEKGVFSVDRGNPDCSNDIYNDYKTISDFSSSNGNKAIFSPGPKT